MKLGGILGGSWEDKWRNLLGGGEEGGKREERGEVSRRKGGNG